MILSGIGEISVVPARNAVIDLDDRKDRDGSISPFNEGIAKSPIDSNHNSPLAARSPLPADLPGISEDELEALTPPPLPLLPEIDYESMVGLETDAGGYDLDDLKTPPPLPPLRDELNDEDLYSYGGLSPLNDSDEDDLIYLCEKDVDDSEKHEPLEFRLSGMRISQELERESFEYRSRNTVSPWRDITPRARQAELYSTPHDETEADMLEYNLVDAESPTTPHYASSPPKPRVDIKQRACVDEQPQWTRSFPASQPPPRQPKAAHPGRGTNSQAAGTSMPDYKNMSLDVLKDHAKVYGLRVKSQRMLVSQLEHIWQNLYGSPIVEEPSGSLTQPAPTSTRLKPLSSTRASSSASEMGTDEEGEENDLDASIWDLTESEVVEEVGTTSEPNLEGHLLKFIQNDPQLYNSILCYKPVEFEKLYETVLPVIPCKRHELRDFLDNRGILAIFSKEGWRARRVRTQH
ncbi:hypothetical protein K493DRAFT_95683 [Basidiobolus meristosporus CBS 931.73]|uniref:Structure-specific endonuclease subunit SLX4 n=1 Tax=Basidiobolus meristosporus CBS 931.73 TaxID=1314790 RepID=A0A1Y1X638_9FUNG|nr:hypothetical protein K493DRAFT_95683 [Basidiobolus meristosporus CBS 931.73]|eukprot:ORX81257.1 hypothetical protein K493DRAFT_95683 [Basidiobolus meristosporus CBS 931.73]